jgi:hypothetical protein
VNKGRIFIIYKAVKKRKSNDKFLIIQVNKYCGGAKKKILVFRVVDKRAINPVSFDL